MSLPYLFTSVVVEYKELKDTRMRGVKRGTQILCIIQTISLSAFAEIPLFMSRNVLQKLVLLAEVDQPS